MGSFPLACEGVCGVRDVVSLQTFSVRRRGVDAGPEAMARLPAARDQLVALGLTKLEVLQVLNLRPTKVVEAYVCLSNVEERGLDMEDLLEASKRVRPRQCT